MEKLKKIIILSNENYEYCKEHGAVEITKGGVKYTINWEPDKYQYYTPAPISTSTNAGLMSAEQAAKLEGIIEIPETTTAGQVLKSTGVAGIVQWGAASNVSVSPTGTSTTDVNYITIDGVEYRLSGGGGTGSITENTFVFEKDIVTMYNIGKYSGTTDVPLTIPVKNKTFKQAWNEIFVNTVNPTVTQPSWTDTYSDSDVTGAILSDPKITLAFNKGSYQYGPDTNVTVTALSVNGVEKTLTNNRVTVSIPDTITVPMTANVNSIYSYSGAVNPKNNIGEDVPELKIADATNVNVTYTHEFPSTGTLNVTKPSATLSVSSHSEAEAGSKVTPSYTIAFNNINGVYPYKSYEDKSSTSANLTTTYTKSIDGGTYESTQAGTFYLSEVALSDTATQSKVIKVKSSWNNSDRTPLSSKGNKVPSVKITSGNTEVQKTITIPKGYRKIFYGYSLNDSLTSAVIRALPNGEKNKALTKVNISEDRTQKCIIIAAPKNTRTLTKVTMPSSSQADVTSSFIKQTNTVMVEGYDGYTAVEYDVWLYKPATMAGTYEITMA